MKKCPQSKATEDFLATLRCDLFKIYFMYNIEGWRVFCPKSYARSKYFETAIQNTRSIYSHIFYMTRMPYEINWVGHTFTPKCPTKGCPN